MIAGIVAGGLRAGDPDAVAIYNSLLGWWDMEDNETTGADNKVRLVNALGTDHLMIHQSGATTAAQRNASGKIGASMLVQDSTGSQYNLCFENPNQGSTLLDFAGDTSFTVGLWIKFITGTNPDFAQHLMGRYGSPGGYAWSLYRDTTSIRAFASGDGTTVHAPTEIAITATNWNFLALRLSAAGDLLSLRVNGATNNVGHSTGVYASGEADFSIGRNQTRSTHSSSFSGTSSDFEVDSAFACDAALTDAQLDMLYNSGAGLDYAALAALAGH